MKKYILLGGFFAFSGCDSSKSENNNEIITETINEQEVDNTLVELSGTVVDGYISGAIVCLDENKNNKCDINEIRTKTDSRGKYKFKILNKKFKGQIISNGGTDIISGKKFNNLLKANISNNQIVNLNPISTIAASKTITNDKDVATSIGIKKEHINKDVYKEDNKNTFIYGLKLQKILDLYKNITKSSDEEYNLFLTKFSDSNFKGAKKALNYFLKDILEKIDIKLNRKNYIEMLNILSDILLLSEHDENYIEMSDEEICKIQYKLDNRRDLIIDFFNQPGWEIEELYLNIEKLYETEEYSNTFRLLEILDITNNIEEKLYYLKNTPEIFDYNLKCNSTVLDLEFLLMEDIYLKDETKKFYLSIIDNERKKYDVSNTMFYEDEEEKVNLLVKDSPIK
jgi:hypothetical protein